MNLTSNRQIEAAANSLVEINKGLKSPKTKLLSSKKSHKSFQKVNTQERLNKLTQSLEHLSTRKLSRRFKQLTVAMRHSLGKSLESQVRLKKLSTAMKRCLSRSLKVRVKLKQVRQASPRKKIHFRQKNKNTKRKKRNSVSKKSSSYRQREGLWQTRQLLVTLVSKLRQHSTNKGADGKLNVKHPHVLKTEKAKMQPKRGSPDKVIGRMVRVRIEKRRRTSSYRIRKRAWKELNRTLSRARSASRLLSPRFNFMKSQKKWFRRYSFASKQPIFGEKTKTASAAHALNHLTRKKPSAETTLLLNNTLENLQTGNLVGSSNLKNISRLLRIQNRLQKKTILRTRANTKTSKNRKTRYKIEKLVTNRKEFIKSAVLLARALALQKQNRAELVRKSKQLNIPHKPLRGTFTQKTNWTAPFVGVLARARVKSLVEHTLKLTRGGVEVVRRASPLSSRIGTWRERRNANGTRVGVGPGRIAGTQHKVSKLGTKLVLPKLSLLPRRPKISNSGKRYASERDTPVVRGKERVKKKTTTRLRFKPFRPVKLAKPRKVKTFLISAKGQTKLLSSKLTARWRRARNLARKSRLRGRAHHKTMFSKNARFTRPLNNSRVEIFLTTTKPVKQGGHLTKTHSLGNPLLLPLVTKEFLSLNKKFTPITKYVLTSTCAVASHIPLTEDLRNVAEYVKAVRRKKEITKTLEFPSRYSTESLELAYAKNLNYFASGQVTLPEQNTILQSSTNHQLEKNIPFGILTPGNNLKEIRTLLSNWASDKQSLSVKPGLHRIKKDYSLVFAGQQYKGRTSNISAEFGSSNLYTQESWFLESEKYSLFPLSSTSSLSQTLRSLFKRRLKKSRFAPEGSTKIPTNLEVLRPHTDWSHQILNVRSLEKREQSLRKSRAKTTEWGFGQFLSRVRIGCSFAHLRRIVLKNYHSRKGFPSRTASTKLTNKKNKHNLLRRRPSRLQKRFVLLKRKTLRTQLTFFRGFKKRQKVGRRALRRLKKPLPKQKRRIRQNIAFFRALKNRIRRPYFRLQPSLSVYHSPGPIKPLSRLKTHYSDKIISNLAGKSSAMQNAQGLTASPYQVQSPKFNFPRTNTAYVALSPNAAIAILSSPFLLKLQHGQAVVGSTPNKMSEMLNLNLGLFDKAPSLWHMRKSSVRLRSTNLVPSNCFRYTISKKLASFLAHKNFKHNVLPLLYNTLIRFMEHVTGTKCAVQVYPFVSQHVSQEAVTRYQLWIPRLSFYERRLGHRFFLEEALHIMHLSFVLRDASIVAYWLRSMILRISFWKTRSIFRFLRYLVLNYYKFVFADLQVKGMKIKLKGKISAAGNSRKRTILFRTGRTSHSSVNSRVSYKSLLVNTFTGVMGFQLWLFY